MKRRDFTFSIQAEHQDLSELQSRIEQYPEWAWVIHDEDKHEDGTPTPVHLHGYVAVRNPRAFASIAEDLQIPVNMVQKVISRRAILRYLIHKDQPTKYQYSQDEVRSNIDLTPYYSMDNANSLWQDFKKLRIGEVSPDDFYDLHKAEINKGGLYQRLRVFEIVHNQAERRSGR